MRDTLWLQLKGFSTQSWERIFFPSFVTFLLAPLFQVLLFPSNSWPFLFPFNPLLSKSQSLPPSLSPGYAATWLTVSHQSCVCDLGRSDLQLHEVSADPFNILQTLSWLTFVCGAGREMFPPSPSLFMCTLKVSMTKSKIVQLFQ